MHGAERTPTRLVVSSVLIALESGQALHGHPGAVQLRFRTHEDADLVRLHPVGTAGLEPLGDGCLLCRRVGGRERRYGPVEDGSIVPFLNVAVDVGDCAGASRSATPRI